MHLLKILPASLLAIVNCWGSVLGSTPEGTVPMLPPALGTWLAAEDVVMVPQAGIVCRLMSQTQICIKISPCSICLIFYFCKKKGRLETMRVWWWLCKDGLVKTAASYTFLTILAPVSEIPNGLITRIRRMSFLLQRLQASHRQPKQQEMKLPIAPKCPDYS